MLRRTLMAANTVLEGRRSAEAILKGNEYALHDNLS